MKVSGILVIFVISRQQHWVFQSSIKSQFMNVSGILALYVIIRQHNYGVWDATKINSWRSLIPDHAIKYQGSKHHHNYSKHGYVRYSCNSCDHKATQLGSLKKHKYSINANFIYYCDSCGYKATILDNSKTHIKSIHKGVRSMNDIRDLRLRRIISWRYQIFMRYLSI